MIFLNFNLVQLHLPALYFGIFKIMDSSIACQETEVSKVSSAMVLNGPFNIPQICIQKCWSQSSDSDYAELQSNQCRATQVG